MVTAMTPDSDGGMNQSAIEEFREYSQTYLGMAKEIYRSGMPYVDIYNQVTGDLEQLAG